MTSSKYEITATCDECGYHGSLAALELHSCDIQKQGGRCEDYPCCGHTDGDGCQTLPEHTSAYWSQNPHLLCDHEAGICEVEYDEDDEDEDICPKCDEFVSYCRCVKEE